MPQDKRLIVMKTVVHKLQRVCGDASPQLSVELEFMVPSIVLQTDPTLTTHIFALQHRVYPHDGRTSVLIVPKVIALDCSKINRRHGYFDAVVAAEAICRRGDEASETRATQVAKSFSVFIVDSRITAKMPPCIRDAVSSTRAAGPQRAGGEAQGGSRTAGSGHASKEVVPLSGLEDREGLAARLATVSKGTLVVSSVSGVCKVRIGHGGMTAGDLCENVKAFLWSLKQEYPSAWKFVREFKLTTLVTEPIRYMEVGGTR